MRYRRCILPRSLRVLFLLLQWVTLPVICQAQKEPADSILDLGSLHKAKDAKGPMESRVAAAIALNRETFSYPAMFSDYIGYQLDDYPDANVLVLPAGTKIKGNLQLDWDADWLRGKRIVAIDCQGDLSVDGNIVNDMLEGGPLLFVGGSLKVHNLKKGGASIIILGDLKADGWVIGEYNDGVMRIGGDLEAKAFLLLDHDGFVRGETRARELNGEEISNWQKILVAEVFDQPEDSDSWPDVERIWARLIEDLAVFRKP
ncbi:MAG: hypothetical protein K0U98_24975 [Deltaproteobacteria bacterium]|nr:hypothetical protein [Deltaproteobacteria bacterium]